MYFFPVMFFWRGGWMGQLPTEHCSFGENRTHKWTTPYHAANSSAPGIYQVTHLALTLAPGKKGNRNTGDHLIGYCGFPPQHIQFVSPWLGTLLSRLMPPVAVMISRLFGRLCLNWMLWRCVLDDSNINGSNTSNCVVYNLFQSQGKTQTPCTSTTTDTGTVTLYSRVS